MEVDYVNLRIKKGYGVTKVAKPVKDKNNQNIPDQYVWGSAHPKNRGEFGDPPVKGPNEGPTYNYWPEQKALLNKGTTTNMLYKAVYTRHYSTYREVPYGTWDIGDSQPTYPDQWMKGEVDPVFGLHFDPILMDTDGADGLPRQLRGKGPYETGEMEVVWCEDDPSSRTCEMAKTQSL